MGAVHEEVLPVVRHGLVISIELGVLPHAFVVLRLERARHALAELVVEGLLVSAQYPGKVGQAGHKDPEVVNKFISELELSFELLDCLKYEECKKNYPWCQPMDGML